MSQQELIWNIEEAIEEMEQWRHVYFALLEITHDRNQAIEALAYIINLDKEMKAS